MIPETSRLGPSHIVLRSFGSGFHVKPPLEGMRVQVSVDENANYSNTEG